jgi:hypothetical protein
MLTNVCAKNVAINIPKLCDNISCHLWVGIGGTIMTKKNKKPSKGELAYELAMQYAEDVFIAKRLRYMNPKNIAEDFPTPHDQKVIAAVFKWLSLNSVCAWKDKQHKYSVVAMSKTVKRTTSHDAIVLDVKQYQEAEKALGIKPPIEN